MDKFLVLKYVQFLAPTFGPVSCPVVDVKLEFENGSENTMDSVPEASDYEASEFKFFYSGTEC